MTILGSPLHALEDCLRSHRPSHVIGLLSPDMTPPTISVAGARRLNLAFNDIVSPREGLVTPDATHVDALLAFLRSWDRRSTLLIHCWAGVSRSTAAAYVAACVRDGAGAEQELAGRLREAAPFATPNALIIALADAALGRKGEMARAISKIGRGAETAMGAPFRL